MRVALAVLALSLSALPAAAQDRDGDRVPDAADLCPDAREGADALFPDGCPDGDGDHDGVVDDYDACPAAPETANGHHDLDGCPDDPAAPAEPGVVALDGTRVGCWDGAVLLDVAGAAAGGASLVPRADAPTWMGTAPLTCYATVAFDGRRALHCATEDGTSEATLAMRADGASAIGVVAFRSAHGLDHRAWQGAAPAPFDRQSVADAVAARGEAIVACYQEALATAPALAGRVVVRVTVPPVGAIRASVASDAMTPAHPEVAACILRALDGLTVPVAPRCAPVTLAFPFAFEPEP